MDEQDPRFTDLLVTDLHPTMATTPEIISPTEHDGFVDRRARLQSAIVLVLGLGLFLALPFVLSIGSVVFCRRSPR